MKSRTLSYLAWTCGVLTISSAALAVCYTPLTVKCCDLTIYEIRCRDCSIDKPCCDLKTGGGTVAHNRSGYPPGASGNEELTDGPTCTCTIQTKTCSDAGYCVNLWQSFDEKPTPSAPSGAGCQVPASP